MLKIFHNMNEIKLEPGSSANRDVKHEPGSTKDVSLKDKWTRLLMDMLGWEEEEDLWSWVGKVRGGWEEQFQVLRSAPLMMMMMDAEEDLKTKWKKRWREAITGDGEMRIRDHMDDKEVQKRVKLVDTASFTVNNRHTDSSVRIFNCNV